MFPLHLQWHQAGSLKTSLVIGLSQGRLFASFPANDTKPDVHDGSVLTCYRNVAPFFSERASAMSTIALAIRPLPSSNG